MNRIEVSRDVLVEPSSVALVLAGPAARELWPHRNARTVDIVGTQTPRSSVEVDPPARSGVGFVAPLRVSAADAVVAAGRMFIGPGETGGCRLALSLVCDDRVAAQVERDARRYLDAVATVTRERASAA